MILVITLLLLILLPVFIFTRSSKRRVPGLSKRDKITGNLTDIAEAGGFLSFLKILHTRFGPIASYWQGDVLTVSIANPKHFKETEKMFDRHPALFKFAEPLISSKSLQFLNGEFGKGRYKMMTESFSFSGCSAVFGQITEIVGHHIGSWQDGDIVPLHESMMKLAINIITQTNFGAHFKDETNSRNLHHQYSIVIDDLDDVLNGLWTFGSGDEREVMFEQNLRIFKAEMKKIVTEHRIRKEDGDYSLAPFLDTLLDNIDDEDEVVHQAITFMIGGFHTTGTYMTWLFYFLSQRPDIQRKVMKEVKRVRAEENFTTINDMRKLVYTRKVMNETLRFGKIGLFSERQAERDTEIGGFVITKGSQILHALALTLDDPETFANPTEFDPEANFPEDKSPGMAYTPFGFGVRKCPGYRFADMEMAIVAVEALSRFRFELTENQEKVKPAYGFVTKPDKEIFVNISKI